MQLKKYTSEEIESLKREVKKLKKTGKLSHSQALDLVAQQAGYTNWSLLMKHSIKGESLTLGVGEVAPTVEELEDWFREHHTPAVEVSPYDGREGGYLWPVMDDTDVDDVMRDNFPNAADDIIEQAALSVLEDGPWMEPKFMEKLYED